jgi:CheY-like chemotaxis protein
MHALIIEDQALVASVLEDQLRDLGYTTFDFAASEAEAIDAASIRCPDLITADERLTDGSGIKAVQQICEAGAIPVVFITGDPDPVMAAIPEAVILLNPFRMADLRQAVGDALVAVRRSMGSASPASFVA